MKYIFLIVFTVVSAAAAFGQAAPSIDAEKERQRAREQAYNDSVDRLRNVGKTTLPMDRNAFLRIYTNKIRPLYRKPTVAELAMLEPDANLRAVFKELLATRHAGVIKLIADEGCEAKFNIAVATPHCEEYRLPGAGSSYSFRQSSHWLRHLSDLNFDGEKFTAAPGDFIHGILVNIGDVPLEKVPETKAFATLSGFEPVSDVKRAAAFSGLLEKGVRDGQLFYSSTLPVMKYSTFLVRSIAYRTEFYRAIDGVEYDEMDFDNRNDIIVAFRVVGFETDKSVTFAWKEVARKESPRMKR